MVSFLTLTTLCALAAGFEAPVEAGATVLVTGATGRTGSLLYAKLKADSRVASVRALVTSIDKARLMLNCTKSDPSEGIYLGNVTQVSTLTAPMKGVSAVAITVGASPYSSPDLQRAIEFTGVQNQVRALAAGGGAASAAGLRVVLCSSMGTTAPSPKHEEGGSILFWKLNAEAFLGASGVGSVVVKPCGLSGSADKTLLVGHDDSLLQTSPPLVARENVAAIMAEAVALRSANLRFDLCSKQGPATTDLGALLAAAALPWQK